MDIPNIVTVLTIALAISLAINLAMFVVAFRLQSDKLTDISYAATFATLSLWALVNSQTQPYHLVLSLMLFLWAVRLGGFLLYRVIKNGKDARFDDMRGNFWQFGKFWLTQAFAVWALMIPSLLAFDSAESAGTLAVVGVGVWTVGFIWETVADVQKLIFARNPANKNKWIDTGLWRYSRHPNYFGEITVWIGIYLYAVASLSLPYALVGLISPVFITVLLVRVSGIPILERSADKRWGNLAAYKRYKQQTSVLIPWIKPRSS